LSVIVENEVVGWMKLFDNKDENKFYVSSLYVLPKFQGYGIGKELILLAEDKAKQLNYSEVWIGVMEQNVNTLNWYRKLGFNFVSVEPFRMGETEVAHLIGFKPVKS
jgi:ribosomal protein S18 acetylase RimI-like enzyme